MDCLSEQMVLSVNFIKRIKYKIGVCNYMKNNNQKIESIGLSEIMVGAYQRNVSDARALRIAKEFDAAKVGVLIVSKRANIFYIIDGQHRLNAMRILNIEYANCIVLEGLTYEEESDYFRKQNKDYRALSLQDRFLAGVEAHDEMCMKINAVINKNGFVINRSNRSHDAKALNAVKAVELICELYGYEILDKTLELISRTWPGDTHAKQREMLVGISEFINTHGPRITKETFITRFEVVPPSAILRQFIIQSGGLRTESMTKVTARRLMCWCLTDFYNKGLRVQRKLKMEA